MIATCAFLFALSIAQPPQQQPDSTGRLAGRVTVEGTGAAIAGASVLVFPNGRPTTPMGMPPQAVTDQDGRFAFDRLAPGTYNVDVQKTGFVPLNQPMARSRVSVDIVAGGVTPFDVQLRRGGVISGRLLDPSGEPLADARVVPMQRLPANTLPGNRIFPAGPGAQTNDLGEFRIPSLAAGEYYVVATPRGGSSFGGPGVTPPPAARTTMAPTFFPGTADQASAAPVTVSAGAEVGNISFTMQSVPAFRVSGIVVDDNGEPVANAMVMLIADSRAGGMFLGPAGNSSSLADGRFTVGGVVAGTYRVNASVPFRLGASGVGGGVVSWSSGGAIGGAVVTGGVVAGGSFGVVNGATGANEPPTEITIVDGDVSGVRLVVRRPHQ